MGDPPKSTVKPSPIALIVCDSIYSDSASGKTALVGLFTGITAVEFPAVHPRLAIFASLTGLRERSHARVEIVHTETDEIVATVAGPFPQGVTPLTIVDLSFVMENTRFPAKGRYEVRFWVNDHILMCRPFNLRKLGEGEP